MSKSKDNLSVYHGIKSHVSVNFPTSHQLHLVAMDFTDAIEGELLLSVIEQLNILISFKILIEFIELKKSFKFTVEGKSMNLHWQKLIARKIPYSFQNVEGSVAGRDRLHRNSRWILDIIFEVILCSRRNFYGYSFKMSRDAIIKLAERPLSRSIISAANSVQ